MDDKNFPMMSARSAEFPHAWNVDVDSTTPTYDYSRWTAGARLRLYHVQWTRDNVVDFGTESKRDAWFDAHAAVAVTLETSANISVDGTIKLPIPFTTLRRYNYVTVDYPGFPVDRVDNPIALYAYRLLDVRSAAPSTSIAIVELDEWQTYRYRLTFSRCALDRGHFAVNKTPDVETYLADPIDSSDWVRIPEPDAPASGPRQITAHQIFDIWGGGKYVVLGSTAPAAAWRADIPTPGKVDAGAAPAYADTEDRYGYQYDVTAGWNPAGEDWGNAPGVDSITTATPDGRAPALTAIAFRASDVYGANRVMDRLQVAAPWLYESVRAAIIVPASFISVGQGFDFLGVKAYECKPAQNPLWALRFQGSDFDYPADCMQWTKLYAWPWAVAEVSDDLGHTLEIRIEDCANGTTINTRCVALFPFVKASAFVLGYETRGKMYSYNYEFTRLDGSKGSQTFYGTNPSEHSFEMDIPTFALWRNSSATLAYDQGAQWERTGRHAITDYHNAMRSANTSLENTKASAATSRSNAHVSNALALSNATRSADTGLTNAKASSATTRSNAHVSNALALSNATRSADTGLTNAKASAATSRSNAHVSNALALSNATRSADTGLTNAKASSATTRSNAHVSNALALSNAKRSADTGLTSAKASADTARTNVTTQTAAQTQATDRTNTNAVDNTTLSNELATYTTTRNVQANILITGFADEQSSGTTPVGSNIWKIDKDYVTDSNFMTAEWSAANAAKIESIQPMMVTNAAQGITGAASSLSGVTGSMGAHMATSALAGTAAIAAGGAAALAVGATAIQTIGASLQYGINLTKEKAIMDANRDMMAAKRSAAEQNMHYVNIQQRDLATDITKASTDKAAQIVQNSANTARDTTSYAVKAANDVADANKTTAYANAQRSRDTAVSNATDSANTGNNIADTVETTTNANAKLSRDTSVSNATDSANTGNNIADAVEANTNANAQRSRDTSVDNATDSASTGNNIADTVEATTNATAGYSRTDVAEYAAKQALENARLDLMAEYRTAGRTQPTARGADSGNVDMLEWGGAVHVRVRTQPVAELERAASNFALTGYAGGGRLIDTKNTLQVRKHYSYWRGTMWVNPAPGVPWSAIDDIRDAFTEGLTVWSKPEEIGAVDPFSN